jgi:hypothetical protein
MVKYCAYLLGEDWLLQRGLELGLEPPKTRGDQVQTILLASREARMDSGVYTYTKFQQVKTPQGKVYWCIAFASNDPYEGLPTTRPPEEKYKALQELLQRNGPPRWFRGS